MGVLYPSLCSYENLFRAYRKARKGKTTKKYILEFEQDLVGNLLQLHHELVSQTYQPKPLQEFILHDPKTRKINRSAFRDRIVHHAICIIIEPFFEKHFIFDSYANRIGKGAFKAVNRFYHFQKQLSHNNTRPVFVLKADIRQYFENVNHSILLSIIQKRVSDQSLLWLIKTILSNYKTKEAGIGMPLGNLTSQFFANVFLNELDKFVKHTLKARYYIRYVDDFVILDTSPQRLSNYKEEIQLFLAQNLKLTLHQDKSRIIFLSRGVGFLGLKLFPHHKTLKKKNVRKFKRKLKKIYSDYHAGLLSYDSIYDFLEGWVAYAKNANTYNLRCRILSEAGLQFQSEISTKEYNRHLKEEKDRIFSYVITRK